MEYRKIKGSDTWHFCKNCSKWPTVNYETAYTDGNKRPPSGELDNECLAKERGGNCTKA